MDDLTAGLKALDQAQPSIEEATRQYEGTMPEFFASLGVARYLRGSGSKFRINWCRTVVTAVLNRLSIAAVTAVPTVEVDEAGNPIEQPATDSPAQAKLDACWYANRMGLATRNFHEAALSQGETYAIVWPDDDDQPIIHHNPATQVKLIYDAETGLKKRYAVKRWVEGERIRANLYYPDRIERWVSTSKASEGTVLEFIPYYDVAAGETEEDAHFENPYKEVPVFHFRPQWPDCRPEHLDAYGAQNGLNKLLASYYGTVDFTVFPQRYALLEKSNSTTQADADFAEDEDPANAAEQDQPKTGPGTVWWLDNAKAVGQFAPADPKVFWDPVQQLVQHMALTTDTPWHMFQFGGQPPSGESRRAANESLYAKVTNRQSALGATWEELWTFVLKVAGTSGAVQIDWAPIDRADDKDGLEAAEKKRALGVPDDVVLREVGYTDLEMDTWTNTPVTMDAAPADTPGDSPTEGAPK